MPWCYRSPNSCTDVLDADEPIPERSNNAVVPSKPQQLAVPTHSSNAARQLVFSGTAVCVAFQPLKDKADLCLSCMKSIDKHERCAVQDCQIAPALEFSVPALPSEVIAATSPESGDTESCGGLFLGGFKSVLNNE